jgi:glycerol-3-phosphate acyltransferase PlsY
MLLMALVAFACGSVPFGVLIARAHGRDIMQEGSRNPGATNVGRVLGKPWGFLCFGLDFLKGFVPVAIAGHQAGLWGRAAAELTPAEQFGWVAIAAAAMLGHMFSPWIRFKGGKGVATAFGGLAALWPAVTVPVLVAFPITSSCCTVLPRANFMWCTWPPRETSTSNHSETAFTHFAPTPWVPPENL